MVRAGLAGRGAPRRARLAQPEQVRRGFKTSESGSQGQFLGSDPTYTQYDEAIVKNLGLNFKVVFSGGETATVAGVQEGAEEQGVADRLLLEPQYIHAEVPMERVKLPPVQAGL